jgi:type IX secretion system PorP/SprF family membrane protein
MKIILKYTIIALIIFPYWIVAQQLPLFTQYREYNGIVNPASINSDYFLDDYHASFGTSLRLQWMGASRNPKTSLIRGEYFHKSNKANFHLLTGGWLLNDQTGPTSTTNLNARIAVLRSAYPEKAGFCAGLSMGGGQFRLDANSIDFKDKSDIVENISMLYPDISLGIYGYKALSNRNNYLYGGISIPQVFTPDLGFRNTNGDFNLQRIRHYYGTIGFNQFLGDRSFWEVSSWLKYVPNTPIQVDLNARYRLKGSFWLGLGYSTAKNLHTEVGYIIEYKRHAFKIGYGYDNSFNGNANYFGASHEINLAVLIGR